jgi:hypothetical protein
MACEKKVRTVPDVLWKLLGLVALVIVFPLFFGLMLWMASPTGQKLRVHDMEYIPDSGELTIYRTVLVDSDVWSQWTISVEANGHECTDSGRMLHEAETSPGNPKTEVTIYLSPRLRRCFDQPGDRVIVASFQALLWNMLPLQPTWYFDPPRG